MGMEVKSPRTTIRAAAAGLRQAGWEVDLMTMPAPGGSTVWVITGRNGENLIRVDDPSEEHAWQAAVDQARSAGMWPGLARLGFRSRSGRGHGRQAQPG